jgi:hypothetical protein
MKRTAATLVLACSVLAVGCESPEAARTRGGGPGGDPGNRPAQVKMHEGSRQYYETPVKIPGEPMSLDPAQQARQLSLSTSDSQQETPNSEKAPSSGAGRGQ